MILPTLRYLAFLRVLVYECLASARILVICKRCLSPSTRRSAAIRKRNTIWIVLFDGGHDGIDSHLVPKERLHSCWNEDSMAMKRYFPRKLVRFYKEMPDTVRKR